MPFRIDSDDAWDDEDGCCSGHDEDATAECPRCHEPVFAEAERCPHCGWYISEEDAPPSRLPGFIVLGLTLAAVAVYVWVTR